MDANQPTTIRNIGLYDLRSFDHPTLKRELVRRFGELSEVANVWNFSRHVIQHILGWALILTFENGLARAAVVITMAFNLVGIFILQHDAGHRSRSKRRWLNDAMGDIAGGLFGFGIPWVLAREQHRLHHRLNAQLDDPTALWMPLTAAEYLALSPASRWLYRIKMSSLWCSWMEYANFRTILPSVLPEQGLVRERLNREIWRSGVVSVAMNLGQIALAWALMGGAGVLLLYALPNFLAINIGTIIERLSHSHPEMRFYPAEHDSRDERDMQGTVCIEYPPLVAYLINNMNEATIHHYVPSVPCYRQREARAYVEAHHPGLFNKVRFSWAHLREVYAGCHLLASREDPRYISFAEAHALAGEPRA